MSHASLAAQLFCYQCTLPLILHIDAGPFQACKPLSHLLISALLITGEKRFLEVSASMAQRGLIRGTPLRTLCLLLSNRPDLVHESSLAQPSISPSTAPGPAGQAPMAVPYSAAAVGGVPVAPPGVLSPGALGLPGVRTTNPGILNQNLNPAANPTPGLVAGGSGAYTPGSGGGYRGSVAGFFTPGAVGGGGDVLLSQWRENLAMMAANRTAADLEPIMQLGDRLLQEQQQVRLRRGATQLRAA